MFEILNLINYIIKGVDIDIFVIKLINIKYLSGPISRMG